MNARATISNGRTVKENAGVTVAYDLREHRSLRPSTATSPVSSTMVMDWFFTITTEVPKSMSAQDRN
jgi:hypothetical protein